MKRDLVTIDDLSNQEIESIFKLADEFLSTMATPEAPSRLRGRTTLANNYVLATLFYEPSTRTRFSFESAMYRLGGHVLAVSDPTTTSAVKGESIADSVRVMQNYADLIVIRHPWEGTARVAANYADIPVINAGDGSHEHPTQTLCDLYTLRRENKSLKSLNVLLCGDLKNGRTIHSLVYALARFGANIIPMPAEGLELPKHVQRRLAIDYAYVPVPKEQIKNFNVDIGPIDVVYVSERRPHQLRLLPTNETQPSQVIVTIESNKIDVCYVTRRQLERQVHDNGLLKSYPVINKNFLKGSQYKNTKVLHPLPRVDELGYDLDKDERGIYFKQAAYGVPVRMALIASLLELKGSILTDEKYSSKNYEVHENKIGISCNNKVCIVNNEIERKHLSPKFFVVQRKPAILRCAYCENELYPKLIGKISAKKYYLSSDLPEQIQLSDYVFFSKEDEAKKIGYRPYTRKRLS